MTTHKLIPYWMTLRESNNPGFRWDLDEIIYSPAKFDKDSIIDILEGFSKDYLGDDPINTEILRDSQKTFTMESDDRTGRTLQGVMSVGRWGEGANHFNVNEEKREREARSPADAVEIPYYFLFHLPARNPTKALFILHRPGNMGAKGALETVLDNWFHRDVYYEFDPIVSDDLLEQIINADRLLKLKLERDQIAEAPHQRVSELFDGEDNVKQIVEFRAHSGQDLPINTDGLVDKVQKMLSSGQGNNMSGSTSKIIEDNFDQAKLSIEQDGSTRTFSLDNNEVNMHQILDPDEDGISMDSMGHPEPQSISPVAIEFANDILGRHEEPKIPTEHIMTNGTL